MNPFRFFVSNLPANTKEEDLKCLFQYYGQIEKIELKIKKNLVRPDDTKKIAFVTIKIGAKEAEYCLNDLNWKKVHGEKIQVSFAKESFLERLKREREDAKDGVSGILAATEQSFELQSELLKVPRENKRKLFDVHAEIDDDEVASELMITKKRAISSIRNGKIVIEKQDLEPIHVIEIKHKKKQMDYKSNIADQKRKESLNKMKSQYEQSKTVIQQALQVLDDQSKKKLKFSDAESDQEEQNLLKSKTDIFGSDDDGDEILLNPDVLGRRGEKLIKMQAKQSLDSRFHIDAKFVDDDDECKVEDKKSEGDGETQVGNERQWQINILQQVVGTKLDTLKNSADKSHQNKKMLRYDPSKDEHRIFERCRGETEIKSKQKQSESKTKDITVHESVKSNSNAPDVSKDVFYIATDTLQQSLRTRGEGFSLLNMFGKTGKFEERDKQLKQVGTEKILINKKLERSFTIDPFGYDSSSGSESEFMATYQENLGDKEEHKTDKISSKSSKKNIKIATESFFIPKKDIRLKEGAKFFIYKKSDDTNGENYEEVRNRLKLLIKTKITKTKKNLVNAGYKGKR